MIDPATISPDLHPTRIHRLLTLDLPTFDALKGWQRTLQAELRRELTNSEVLRMLVLAMPSK